MEPQLEDYPDICIHQWIELQVEQISDNVAIIFEKQHLTYQELNCRANQLAHYLRTINVSSEVLVGICLERSIDLVVGLLGILKAGGAYVPLDPAYPQERLAFILEDSQLPVILTQHNQLNRLPEHKARVVCLDTDWEKITQHSTQNLDSRVKAENLAYTIYTSGSTGEPKGVQIVHRSVVNFLNSMRQEPGLTKQDVLLAVTTICFDIAALELYLPLVVGARVVLASREVAADAAKLSVTLENFGATVMQATPATWRLLLAAGWQGNKQLKVLCGGEALSTGLANQLLQKVGCLWNMYGPTETTIWSAVYKVEPGDNPVPIGRPIANTQIYLLDHLLRRQADPIKPVPIGVPGEVYIGGVGLARGYLNRPELNDEKFIPNPFSNKPDDRLYKTEDLARYLPNGNIEFIGRIDHQVKIRGYRIELGDIEGAISQHPAVKETVVIARQDLSDETRLVAYVVPSQLPKSKQQMTEQTLQWQKIWNEAYNHSDAGHDPTFNISGINNSYTSLLIPVQEMQEWVDHTTERILYLQPQRVLEIGCGMGLLLFRIAPHCSHYFGVDISATAIRYIDSLLQRQQDLSHVKLCQTAAAEAFEEVKPEVFDTVMINSVIQYFPSIDYLVLVLESAVKAVKPGGRIFIGDVRSLPLLKAFHTSVQLYQAPDSLPSIYLQQRIQERMRQDKELLIDSALFTALKQHLPQISHVQIQLKRGRYQNEFTKFRYDVILHVGTEVYPPVEPLWLDWQLDLTVAAIRQRLLEKEPEILGITGVKNARVAADVAAVELLANSDHFETVKDLREALQKTIQQVGVSGIDPEDLWNLNGDLPYTIHINWSSSSADGSYDVIFQRRSTVQTERDNKSIVSFPQSKSSLKPWSSYANNPLQTKGTSDLLSQLRIFLKDKLPDYMIPSAFVLMDTLPLTPNGKVDRRALPAPNRFRHFLPETFVAPQTSIEKQLAEMWNQVLGIELVGIHDNFFELGGHSLLSVQLLSQVKETFQIDLPLLCLFQAPTVAGLAKAIDNAYKSGSVVTTDNITTIAELNAEAVLDPTICPTLLSIELITEPQRLFLTGATGFIGAFLLHELLQQTKASIYCLVRASSLELGKQKIYKNLEQYLLWNEELKSRIIPVIGDLSQPLLGLAEQQFRELASEIDLIYHNGAFVNLIYPYVALRAANVSGTQEVLRLASEIKVKPVHFISTLDVFQSSVYSEMKIIREQDDLAHCEGLCNGYAQSKWVAEKLVMAARDRGLPVCIYRLGMITGQSQTGVSKTDDLMCRMLKSFIQLGSAPDWDLMINLAPIDYVSSAIIYLSRQKASLGKAFHIVNPQSLHLSWLVNEINSFGYPIQQVAYDEWQTALLNANRSQENALSPLLSLFTNRAYAKHLTYIERFWLASQAFGYQNTINGLADTSITCPAVDSKILGTYFSYFIHSGFFKVP